MNIKFFTYAAMLSIPCACSTDREYPALAIERELSAVVLERNDEIQILNGSGDYSVRVENEEIVSAEILHAEKIVISIHGIKTGETYVFAKDNATGQEKPVRVKIIPPNAYVTLNVLEMNPSHDTPEMDSFLLPEVFNETLFGALYLALFPGGNKAFLFESEAAFRDGNFFNRGTYQREGTMLRLDVGGSSRSYFLNEQSRLLLDGNLEEPVHTPLPYTINLSYDLTDRYGHLFPDATEIAITCRMACRNASLLTVSSQVVFQP